MNQLNDLRARIIEIANEPNAIEELQFFRTKIENNEELEPSIQKSALSFLDKVVSQKLDSYVS
jgi:hypothetical protein